MTRITEEELEAILNSWDESEDEFVDDIDEIDDELSIGRLVGPEVDGNEDSMQMRREEEMPEIKELPTERNLKKETIELKEKYKKILWKNKSIDRTEESFSFKGNSTLPDNIMAMDSAYQFFEYFFSENLLDMIIDETLIYSIQTDPEHPFCLTKTQLRRYLGICVLMSIVQIGNIRKYWHPVVGNNTVMNAMTVNEFEKIRRFLHFNNNANMPSREDAQYDRLFKIRTLIDHLITKYQSVPIEEGLSLDEQICATKAKSYMKQYMPPKPHKWGYKLFVLSGVSGYSYNFEIYTGKENRPDNILADEQDFGASANVVTRLTRFIPKHVGYKMFFDNYYTTLPLVVDLEKKAYIL